MHLDLIRAIHVRCQRRCIVDVLQTKVAMGLLNALEALQNSAAWLPRIAKDDGRGRRPLLDRVQVDVGRGVGVQLVRFVVGGQVPEVVAAAMEQIRVHLLFARLDGDVIVGHVLEYDALGARHRIRPSDRPHFAECVWVRGRLDHVDCVAGRGTGAELSVLVGR